MLKGFLVTKSSLLKEEYSQTNTKVFFKGVFTHIQEKLKTETLQP